ncbi:EAL domain-containing protein [Pseudoalteromonas piratica]|uniref:Diguanylate phosphodiesterase n=1 Tax=Pseudoalteromonas piratica TaxID=1348114 RepID=A0A0A7EB44_9GAMM|nr:EAL domain-containing protein [Pseudoalteromonas piratica]AIY63779.1 diguanylate phosphodiesterase [Pseudoalteromonas piratica]
MHYSNQGIRWIIFACFLFLASLAGYVYYVYSHTYNDIMQDVDARLLNAAQSVKFILGEDYHNNIAGPEHIDEQAYLLKSKQLSEFATRLELEYVYAMISEGDQVYFSASSYTNDDVKNNKLTYFYDLYSEATELNKKAFYSTGPVFEHSEDQWGHFRTIFLPFQSDDGRTYLTGADITIKDLNEQLTASVTQAVITACFFFFIATLVGAFYIFILKRNLTRDPATGYANHIALERKLHNSSQLHMQLAIILVSDLEEIISFYGSHIGDTVMHKLLTRLDKLKTSECTLYRLSSNKIALLTSYNNRTECIKQIENLSKNTPILCDPFIYVTLCTGIASGNKTLLIENARIAVEQAKRSREHVVFYSDAMNALKSQYQHNIKIAKDVRDAFNNSQVQAFFQPIVTSDGNDVLMYEGLARIEMNNKLYEPDYFLSVVNRSRMDGQLTRIIFLECVDHFRKTDTCWSMNITAQDMLDPSLAAFFDDELKRYPTPHNITFELIETEAVANFNEVKGFITMVKRHGAKVFIDDFGTGYSNISNILKLEVDGIKIDASLVSQIIKDEEVFLFIQHIASFANKVNLILIAEGVENKLVVDKLAKAGIKYMQGYYFAEPAKSLAQQEVPAKAS